MTFKMTASFNLDQSAGKVVVREPFPTASRLLRPPAVNPGYCLVLYAAWADSTPVLTGVNEQARSSEVVALLLFVIYAAIKRLKRLKVSTFIYRHLQENPDQQRFTIEVAY